MTIPTTDNQTKKFNPFKQYILAEVDFDAYDKETSIKKALGSDRTRSILEMSELRSVNFVEGSVGWRLTPRGLEVSSLTLGAGTVPISALANITSDRLLGRDTAGSGAVEQLTVSGGIEFSGSGGLQTSAFTGDVTKSAGGTALTIANDAVTFAKFQNITDARLLGRSAGSAGDMQEITIGAGLSLAAGALASTITQYTDEMAQDAVGAMVDASLTYTDATPLLGITAAYKRKSLFDHFADVGNVDTGEDDLYSDTIAASQLANDGEKLETQYALTFVTSATATRQVKAYFGGTMIFDSGALTFGSTGAANLWITIIRESSTVVRCTAEFAATGLTLQPISTYTRITGLTLSNTQILKITGEAAGVGAATDDIVAKMGMVEWNAAA